MKTPLLQSLALSSLLITAAVGQSDPPDRVARLNLATGAVSTLTQSTGPDWVPAQINYPLTSGDQIWTDVDGRAEMHIGSNAIRLRDQTSATFTVLDDQTTQLQLVSGGVNLHVLNLFNQEIIEVDTPNLAFTVREPGDYRIEVVGQQTKVTVWFGSAEISGSDNRTYPMRAGDFAVVNGYGQLSYSLMAAPALDDFDRWAQDRDRQQQGSQSAQYVAPDTIGSEDLDLYGSWSEVPDLGNVWSPRVDPTWVPYQRGHWAWIEPWGWTWIDDEPWGFAPFHYGRWAYVSARWVWVPGPRTQRAVYSPALVVWAGVGGGATRAWFPLGPGEVYVPSHRASVAYVNRINMTNTRVNQTAVTNVYNRAVVNRGMTDINYANRRGLVGMREADMSAGRRGAARVDTANVQITPLPAPRPVQQGQRSGNARVARPPAAIATPSRPVVRRHEAPGARPAVGGPPQTPVARPSGRMPGRESETVRPGRPSERPQVQDPPSPTTEPGRRIQGRDSETVRPAPPARPSERPQLQPPLAEPGRRIPGRDSETVRPAPPARPSERPQVQTPAVQPPPPTPASPPSRQENPERPRRQPPVVESPTVAPAPPARPPERVERPQQPKPEPRVERPINMPPPPQTRPEVRREDKKAPEHKREEKKDDKKQ